MRIVDDLVRIAKGEFLDDTWTRQVYSVDASHYEISPAAVAYPADENDVEQICKYSHEKELPITARGAGTGLLGQSLSDGGIVIDFTKHMDRILEIGDDYVIVQPGIVKGVLDKELKKKNKFLPPDPASSNYCTIGGMIADNSSGVHCLAYGNTIDFLEQVNVVYSDGQAGITGDGSDDRMNALKALLSPQLDLIANGYPKVSKNSCGYRLDAVVSKKFSPQKLFAASEGTLGMVTSAKLKIIDIPLKRSLMVLGFEDVLQAVSAVPIILKLSPVALEMLDHTVISRGSNWGDAGCLLFVEFAGDTDVEDQLAACRNKMAGMCSVLEYASDEQTVARIWSARRGALNDIMKLTVGSRKPVGLIEDTVVNPELLADHAASLLQTYRENKLDYVMYGHVGDGNMHTRPMIDISSEKHVQMLNRIAGTVFEQVIRSGGTITGEHGDGLARVGYIEMMYGRRLAYLFSKVKRLFDPKCLMNPGKKVPVQSFKNGAG